MMFVFIHTTSTPRYPVSYVTFSLTRSFAVPTTTLLASRLSNTSSVLSWPAAPGRGGKLERPSSKLGDGGLGGGGGD